MCAVKVTFLNLGWSNRVDVTPSMIPICDPRPRDMSIRKNRADQNGAPFNENNLHNS